MQLIKFLLISFLIINTEESLIESPYSSDVEMGKNFISQTTMKSIKSTSDCTQFYSKFGNTSCISESEDPLICIKGDLLLKTSNDGKIMCCCNS